MNNVDFLTAVKLFFANYANFKGRSTRAEYWWAMLFVFLCNVVLNAIGVDILCGIFSLVVLIPTYAVMTRRFHDIGKSGKWVWFFILAGVAISVIFFGSSIVAAVSSAANGSTDFMAAFSANSTMLIIGSLLSLALGIWALVWLVKPSGPDNQYGPDPYGNN